jgi:serine-threonine kinase receptor-associated protein
MEKKLRIFDLTDLMSNPIANGAAPGTIQATDGFEIGEGTHTGAIKFIAWTKDPNTIVTASDNTIRWFDLPTRSIVRHEVLDGEIKSCELVALAPEYTSETDIGGGLPVLAVAAGKWVYFWGGTQAMNELKRMQMKYNVASVALDLKGRKIVVGEEPGTWARVCKWEDGSELGECSI